MSRINTNVQSLVAQRVLGQNNKSLGVSLERLATGLKINRGADDPAGLIASQNLRAEKAAIGQAIANSERAEQIVNIAEGGLQEISGLLNELEGLVTATANTAGLSQSEKEANQLQIDSILQTIDRIAGSTSFQGSRLLNGNFDYTTNSVAADVQDFTVNGAKLNQGSTIDVDVVVTNSAQSGGFFLSFGGTGIDLGASTDRFVFEVAGKDGARELSFASGASLTSIAAAVNSFTEVTGVKATVSGTGLRLDSTDFGSDEFVSVKVVNDGSIAAGDGIIGLTADDTTTADTANTTAFNTTAAANGVKDEGQDIGATINGIVATGRGTRASINSDFLAVELDLSSGTASGTANAQTLGSLSAFTINGGGADFQLDGFVDISGKVSLGIGNVSARTSGRIVDGSNIFQLADLGGGKSLNVVDGDLNGAQKSIRAAIGEVSSLRGRLGAFQKNTVGATIRSLGIALENTTAAESLIRDTDFAGQTAELTRNQILVAASTNVLGAANSQPQNVLSLLG
jgi:flagellin